MTKKSKNIMIATIVLAAGAAIAVPIAYKHYSKPDFSKMTRAQIRQYIDSNEFRDANEDKRRETFQQMGEAMQARMEAQVNEYASLPDAQKTVYLDKIIDEMAARRAEFMARDANDANGPPDPNRFRRFGPRDPNSPQRQQANRQPRQPNPSRMRERSSRMSADSMVKMSQFSRDMQNRMQERGIQGPGGRGGFGGPGGFGGGFGGPGGPGGGGPP
jgi:uncharacterized membrane protein YgcG